MKPALIIVDLLRDTFEQHPASRIVQSARAFIPRLNMLIDCFHREKLPVVFACDSFLPEDPIFTAGVRPHSLRGTSGADVIPELQRLSEDHIVPKRRFSSFFKTDLDQTLRILGVDTVLVTGIATHVCVLATALDAVSHDFQAVIVEDCCAAHNPQIHASVLAGYREPPIAPLVLVHDSQQCIKWVEESRRQAMSCLPR